MMRGRQELLGRLKGLEAGQFEELLFRLSVDLSVLPAATVSQSERAIAAIRRLEQEEDGLARLARVLDDLDWFKEFVADGAYPVDQRLLQREIGREARAMEEAAARGENPEDRRVSPERFYAFRPEAAWLGIYRRWDSPRAFHKHLVDTTLRAADSPANCPAAAIVGPGLSGKSVALRRLGVDLAEQGHRVWWVEEPERLLRFGLSRLADVGEGPQFLLIDEIDYLEERYIRRLQSELARKRHLVLVVAGRSLPPLFRGVLRPGEGLYIPDDAGDRADILGKIGEMVPEWAAEARRLAGQPLKRERLLRLLLVLARRGTLRHLREVETAFLQVLADDISRIRSVLPGLAEAIIDAAAIRQLGRDISRQTLLAIADHHQPTGAVSTLLQPIDGNPRWSVAEALVSWNSDYDTVAFHHRELADGLVSAGQRGLLGPRVTGDDPWRMATVELIAEQGSRFSSSSAVGAFARHRPDLLGGDDVVRHIRRLLAGGNGHHYYLTLLVDEAMVLHEEEREELLCAAAAVAPLNEHLWRPAWSYLQRHYQREDLALFGERLYGSGARSRAILNGLLGCLPTARARELAHEWVAAPRIPPDVLCRCLTILGKDAKEDAKALLGQSNDPRVLFTCLNLLGDDAKEDAKALLKQSNDPQLLCSCLRVLGDDAKEDARALLKQSTDPQVLCSCLRALGDEARPLAVETIRHWRNTNPALIVRSFQVAGASPEAREASQEILSAWDAGVPAMLRAAALRAPFDTPLRMLHAEQVLEGWRGHYRPLVAAALGAFWDDPHSVAVYCEDILGRWLPEILYRHKKRLREYDGHIIKALSHPSLRREANQVAHDMLSFESRSPGFLSVHLREQAERISRGEWPPWSGAEDIVTSGPGGPPSP